MKYFMMSLRFNKSNPEEFGLKYKGNNEYVFENDNSVWRARQMYDFGWGAENGFYRDPLPKFSELFELAFDTKDNDNLYGAATVLTEDYPKELLDKIEEILKESNNKKYNRLFEALNLKNPINRSFKAGQDSKTISLDAKRWQNISSHFN